MIENKNKIQATKKTRKLIIIMLVAILIVGTIFAALLYVNDYYKAKSVAKRALISNEKVTVEEKQDYYIFKPNKKNVKEAIIFYPGAKVEETAYSQLASKFAESGYEFFIVKMPMRLAILKQNAADDIISDKKNNNIKNWTLMGHSMGGAMAANYTAGNQKKVDRLVLLAAYGTKDLSKSKVKVLSICGDKDKVINRSSLKKNKSNLPKDTVSCTLNGANHAQYGNYGKQKSDGKATISANEQQEMVLDLYLGTFKEKN
ncbi:alpha/beta fold hydrolase [Lachnobacterium bovis]|uniref:alpha/beta fold hydrolase n=1 Tax=Lachnobacterium bovis TaxID=140626 RepID=UPI00068C2399|nr:alpha/beta fold hydrolase [Lachnobacterium bovis]